MDRLEEDQPGCDGVSDEEETNEKIMRMGRKVGSSEIRGTDRRGWSRKIAKGGSREEHGHRRGPRSEKGMVVVCVCAPEGRGGGRRMVAE